MDKKVIQVQKEKWIEGIIGFVTLDLLSFSDSLVEICNDDRNENE